MTSHSAVESRDSAKQVEGVRRIVLTASGGPFRGRDRAQLADVTPAQAIAHPKWSMGPKISVDSATLMNKGLEVIEAHHLFGLPRSEEHTDELQSLMRNSYAAFGLKKLNNHQNKK